MAETPVKIPASGFEMLAPIWNAVREFAETPQAGSVTLHFNAQGKLVLIESKKSTKL